MSNENDELLLKDRDELVSSLFKTELEFINDVQPLFLIFAKLDWRYVWFYRFLRISPSYNYFLSLVDDYLYKKKIKKVKKRKNYYSEIKLKELSRFGKKEFQKNIPNLFETYRVNGDLREISLTEWWYSFGINAFEIHSHPHVNLIAKKNPGKPFHKKQIEIANKKVFSILAHSGHSPQLLLNIGITADKDKILAVISEMLDEYAGSIQPDTFAGSLKILKSKSHEKKYIDCYQALYFRHLYPNISLEELASKANVLNFSQLGLSEGSRSLQSGVSRLLKNAINISENVAHGIFPSDDSSKICESISFNQNYINKKLFNDVYNQVSYDLSFMNNLPGYDHIMRTEWQVTVL
jgi:hypothetical protein